MVCTLTVDMLKHLAATIMAVSFFLPVLHTQKEEHIYEIDKWICFIKKARQAWKLKEGGRCCKKWTFQFSKCSQKMWWTIFAESKNGKMMYQNRGIFLSDNFTQQTKSFLIKLCNTFYLHYLLSQKATVTPFWHTPFETMK